MLSRSGEFMAWPRMPAIAIVLSLSACATAPPLPQLPADMPATWLHAPAHASAPAPDLSGWWKAFGDARLDRLVARALSGNLGVQQAMLRIGSARALHQHTYANYLPQLGFHTLSEPVPDNSASYFQFGFDTKWEFGFFGRAESHARVTAGDTGVTESEAQALRVSVVAEVVRSYLELRGAEWRLQLLRQLRDQSADKLRLTQARERLQLATAIDSARAESEHAAAEAALADPALAIDRARLQLAVLLGMEHPDDELMATAAPPRLGNLRVDAAPADLLRTRPEIRKAEAEVLKAAGEAGLAEADLYPHLGIGGALTYASRVIGHTRLSDADGIITFGPAIDIPLFDWGARRAVADARTAALSASVLAWRQAVLDGVAEAEIAMATLHRQGERATALARTVEVLRAATESATTRVRLGLADGFEQAAAKDALVQAQLELAVAEQERGIAFVALYKALGGAPLPPESEAEAVEGKH